MDYHKSFYINLPSNVKSPSSFENTTANYITKLPQTIRLQGNWQVGLVGISYPHSWYNVAQRCEIRLCSYLDDQVKYFEGVFLEAGRFDTIEELVNKITEKLDSFTNPATVILPKVNYNKNSRKITIRHGKLFDKTLFFCPSEYLCERLGINYDKFEKEMNLHLKQYYKKLTTINPISDHTGERPIDLEAGFRSIFVYSNIVKSSLVGDIFAPILRLVEVPTNSKFGDQILLDYPNTHYHPLAVKEFDTIEINIKTDMNENIPFEFGRVIIKLHFIQS